MVLQNLEINDSMKFADDLQIVSKCCVFLKQRTIRNKNLRLH
jgi:hypothetical protein